jgi:hypothetical protein
MVSQYRVSIDLEKTCCDCALEYFTMKNFRPPIAESTDPYEAALGRLSEDNDNNEDRKFICQTFNNRRT